MLGCRNSGDSPFPSTAAGSSSWSGCANSEDQRHEEAPEAEQHSRRVRSDLAQPLPGRDQRQAGPTRQQPHPQQQRTLLRRPQRRQLVEGRRGGARMARDEPEREVGTQEGRLEDDHGDRQDPEERVHRAAPYRHPLRSSGACAVKRARDADQRDRQREDETSASERQHLRSASASELNFEGHLVISESRSATNPRPSRLTVTITSRPARKGSGTTPW